MDAKINFTIYDILSYLFPGIVLTLLFKQFFISELQISTGMEILIVIVIGYLTGAILHQIGLLLFAKIYPNNYKSRKFYFIFIFLERIAKFAPLKCNDNVKVVKEKLKVLVTEKLLIADPDNLALFVIADSLSSADKDSDREILLSKEGLFRTLSALMVILGFMFFFVDLNNKLIFFAVIVILLELLRYSREYFRILKNQRIYCLAFFKLLKE